MTRTILLPPKPPGFTIVELLIVIVVIGILATIMLVSYNGITGRAHDVAIQADLEGFANLVTLQEKEEGPLIAADGSFMVSRLEALKWRASVGSYNTTDENNLIGCFNYDSPPNSAMAGSSPRNGRTNWAMIARSKSGTVFVVTSERRTAVKYTKATPILFDSSLTACGVLINQLGAAGFTNIYHGYSKNDTTTGPWRKWTGIPN